MNLKDAQLNKIYYVKEMNLEWSIKRRLMDLGLLQFSKIIKLFNSVSKGISAYEISGCKIALRDNISEMIIVEKGDGCAVFKDEERKRKN